MKKRDRDEERKSILKKTDDLLRKKEKEQSEIKSIKESTDALTHQQRKKKNKEKEKEKIHLVGGGTTSIKEIKDFIAENKQPYRPHFGYEKPYYKRIYEVMGWPVDDHKKFVKRQEVATLTNRLIYGRFPEGVLGYLKKQNPLLFTYIRKYKYFQFLNREGQKELDDFINDFVLMIMGYDDWDRFEQDYCRKYKIPYQTKLFKRD